MTMFKLQEGTKFYQWDKNRTLIVEDKQVSQVHFTNKTLDKAITKEVYEKDNTKMVDVPAYILQCDCNFIAYAYVQKENKEFTLVHEVFAVIARKKPDDYVEEEEQAKWSELEERIRNLEDDDKWEAMVELAVEEAMTKAKESGEFDGKDGQDGKDGVDGKDGQDGKDGYTPVKGIDYFDGKDGIDGKDGQDGMNGQDGYTPIKGVDYFDGKDGKNGQDGKDGQDGYTPQKGVDYFDGKNGEDGYTPVKGTDYFTNADKAEMIQEVLNALPVYNGEVETV